jgi:hypothetical protein
MLISMSASECVADRALALMDVAREEITSICPIASDEWDELLDDKIEEDPEAACFAIIAMGNCVERKDPDAARYLLLKGDDVREVLHKQKRECPLSLDPDSRPVSWGTPGDVIKIVAGKRGDSLYDLYVEQRKREKREKKEKEEKEEGSSPPKKKKSSSSAAAAAAEPSCMYWAKSSSSEPMYLTKIPPKSFGVRPTWIHDGHRIIGSTKPTAEAFQEGDPIQLNLGMKLLVLHD